MSKNLGLIWKLSVLGHHKQKQIEKEKQEQEQHRRERQNTANTQQGYSVGPRPRFAPTRLTSGPRFRSTPGSGLHPVSLTRALSQSNAVVRTPGQRHQPYPSGRSRANFGQGVKRPGGAMRLPTEQNKTPKINMNPNQVIKTEAPDMENVGGNMDQSTGDTTESGTMESSDGAVNSAIANVGQSNSTSSQPESGESTNLSSIVKGEPPELPGIAGNGDIAASGSYSEITAPGGLLLSGELSSITGISAVQANTSVSSMEQHSSGSNIPGTVATVTEQNVLVKTEAEDDDEELEITGVEPGQMSVSDNMWMPNVQTSMGYDPSLSGAVNMGESSGQGYGECLLFVFHLLTSHILPLTLKQYHKHVASFLRNDKGDFKSIWFAVYGPIHYFTLYLYLFFFASFEKNETFMY